MIDPAFWRDRRVLLTGHTGFKGAWLALWLTELGARVFGLGAPAPTAPALHALAGVDARLEGSFAVDLRDAEGVARAVRSARPEVVLHLAAQALVRRGWEDPAGTYAINVVGTANLLEGVRREGGSDGARAVVVATSDKVYAPAGGAGGAGSHVETDPLGGLDPYSASKAGQEHVVAAARARLVAECGTRLATARAGNVIGGGDWAADRLVPDLVRASAGGTALIVRSPDAVRPWQHVLEPLGGYLQLAEALCGPDAAQHARPYNFGPCDADAWPVSQVVATWQAIWPAEVELTHDPRAEANPPEAAALRIDSTRARDALGWVPRTDLASGLAATVDWYVAHAQGADARELCLAQLRLRDLGRSPVEVA